MGTILESLKERFEAAKVRLSAAQQQQQAATLELQAATNDHNIWYQAVVIELREEEKRQAEQQKQQMVLPQVVPDSIKTTATVEDHLDTGGSSESGNKTQLVRDMLRKHAAGITPGGLWVEVRDKISSRAYLYSILKRLRDKEEVSIRRGKYVLRPKMADVKSEGEQVVIQ